MDSPELNKDDIGCIRQFQGNWLEKRKLREPDTCNYG